MGLERSRWLLLALLSACSFEHGTALPDGGDQSPDAVGDASTADACYGSGLFHTCLSAPPPVTFTPSGATLDTSSSTDCALLAQTNGPTVCLIAARAITISSDLTVTGSYPLVLLGTETISVSGAIDVSSHLNPAVIGAGANWSACPAATAAGPNGGGAGGGAGGSFGAVGGNGGVGNNGGGTDVGVAGFAAAAQTPTMVRGGCPGAVGGLGTNNAPGGAGASSGGAIYLLAGMSINVNQTIAANGAGGSQGDADSGGGGGGAGGLIGLEAPTITVAAIVAANGGGGGGGGDGSPAAGGPGSDGLITTTIAAPGGTRTVAYDTTGGSGGVAASTATSGTSNPAAGGGGGGSVGVIYIKGTLNGATYLSPAPSG